MKSEKRMARMATCPTCAGAIPYNDPRKPSLDTANAHLTRGIVDACVLEVYLVVNGQSKPDDADDLIDTESVETLFQCFGAGRLCRRGRQRDGSADRQRRGWHV